jgi:hypothetical protein
MQRKQTLLAKKQLLLQKHHKELTSLKKKHDSQRQNLEK